MLVLKTQLSQLMLAESSRPKGFGFISLSDNLPQLTNVQLLQRRNEEQSHEIIEAQSNIKSLSIELKKQSDNNIKSQAKILELGQRLIDFEMKI